MSKILFIGGPGNISTSTVTELLARGHEVAVFKRSEIGPRSLRSKLKLYRGDRNSNTEIAAALDDFKPEMTVDVCCFRPPQARALISVLRDRVEKHVFVSTVDVYGYPLRRIPFDESSPFAPPVSQYARDKLACEKIFQAAHRKGTLSVAIARPSYSFGPPFVLSFFSRRGGLELISRLEAGKPVVVPGDGQTLMHPSTAYDVGRMIAEIVLEPATAGEDFTCAHESFMTADAYYELFAHALKVEPRLVHVPKQLLFPLEKQLLPDDLLSELTQYHVVFSVEKFRRFFPEFRWKKSLLQGAREYIAFHRKAGDIPAPDNNYEDRIIAAWESCRKTFQP